MQYSPVTRPTDRKRLTKKPVLAIDLGFAANRKSCGLSESDSPLTFGGALNFSADWLREHTPSDAVLILEAPLSGSFLANNPAKRGDFETNDDSFDSRTSSRLWYCGAGGAMALAAIYFLRMLHEQCRELQITVHLVEGFASRYQKDEKKLSHKEVADLLKEYWLDRGLDEKARLLVTKGEPSLSILDLVEPSSAGKWGIPIILRLPDELSSNSKVM